MAGNHGMNQMKKDLARVRARHGKGNYDRVVERVPAGARLPRVTDEDRRAAAALRDRRKQAAEVSSGR